MKGVVAGARSKIKGKFLLFKRGNLTCSTIKVSNKEEVEDTQLKNQRFWNCQRK